ncbi:MAG: hypothetical protein EAZ44_08375 [Cytophagia bacterium]|nr:MAG: hypothetical protein EAZ44_08375 [Cytophagia bacterium]TAG39167.1 MAG: hypothetical protein EAZ31_09570 [Cytophagia bacterium]
MNVVFVLLLFAIGIEAGLQRQKYRKNEALRVFPLFFGSVLCTIARNRPHLFVLLCAYFL